jgi:hypothetical protein
MELREVFLAFSHSLTRLPKVKVEWSYDGSEPVIMSLADYLLRSFAESLVEKGTSKCEVIAALDGIWDDPMYHPQGQPYQIIFKMDSFRSGTMVSTPNRHHGAPSHLHRDRVQD